MLPLSQAGIDLLASNEFYWTELYTIELLSGQSVYLTSSDVAVDYGDIIYYPRPQIKRGKLKFANGVEVDVMDLEIIPRVYPYSCSSVADEDKIGDYNWHQASLSGLLAGATFRLDKLLLDKDYQPVTAIDNYFVGTMEAQDGNLLKLRYKVRSILDVLSQKIPKNTVQPGCRFVLYSSGCGASRDSYEASATILSGSTAKTIICDLTEVDGYYDLGDVLVTSGSLEGVRRSIRSYTVGIIELSGPLPDTPNPGDTISIWPGCDRTIDGCERFFGSSYNLHYGGLPYLPVEEALY